MSSDIKPPDSKTPVSPSRKSWSRTIPFRRYRKVISELRRQLSSGDTRPSSLESGDILVTDELSSSSSKVDQRTRSNYVAKSVQTDLPPPLTSLTISEPSSPSTSTSITSSSSWSRFKAPDTPLPPLEDYGDEYPKLEFNRELDIGHWTLPSGKRPQVENGNILNHFHLFPQLPTELRQEIWRMHLQRPRIVRISTIEFVKKIHFTQNSLGNPVSNIQWYTTNRPPSLMRVCHEARDETLHFYRVHLSHEQRNFYFSPVYLNPEWDILLLTCTHDGFPMDVFLSDVLGYDPRGVGAIHLGSYIEPAKWDCAPLPGCAELSRSARNLRSYTECAYVGTSLKTDVFPILKIGEGYLLESAEMEMHQFVEYMPRLNRNMHLMRSKEIGFQLLSLLPEKIVERLSMQTLFSRNYQPRADSSQRSLATNESAAGLMTWELGDVQDEQNTDRPRYMYFSCN